MAPPPLLPTTRLYACPACREHIKSDTATCPHCGAELHREGRLARAASAVMVSLALSGCPDKGDDTMGGSDSSTGQNTTDASTGNTTDDSSGTSTSGNSGTMTESPTSAEPEYGVPATDTLATTTGTTLEPDYGVPGTTTDATDGTTAGTTTEDTATVGEPEYGVPQTNTGDPEPDYGVPGTT